MLYQGLMMKLSLLGHPVEGKLSNCIIIRTRANQDYSLFFSLS